MELTSFASDSLIRFKLHPLQLISLQVYVSGISHSVPVSTVQPSNTVNGSHTVHDHRREIYRDHIMTPVETMSSVLDGQNQLETALTVSPSLTLIRHGLQ